MSGPSTKGCLSVPGLSWPIVRPREILLEGLDIDGNAIAIEAEEYLARVYQHEVDHLDGVLLIERLDPDQRKQAMRTLRQMTFDPRIPGRLHPVDGASALERRLRARGRLSAELLTPSSHGSPSSALPPQRSRRFAPWWTQVTTSRLVVTRRDTRRSRRGEPEPSPVKKAALDLGLEVTDKLDEVLAADAELGVVVAYGRIIPTSVLDVAADGERPFLAAAALARAPRPSSGRSSPETR